jgi:hypothetical protein
MNAFFFTEVTNSAALVAARHQRDVYYEVAQMFMKLVTPLAPISTAVKSRMAEIICNQTSRWSFGNDGVYGALNIDTGDLVFGNSAILGVYLNSSTPLPNGHDGGDMLSSINNAFGRAVNTSRYYDDTYFTSSSCPITPMYQRTKLDVLDQRVGTTTKYFDFASTSITFDSNKASTSTNGLSANPVLSFDVTKSTPFGVPLSLMNRTILGSSLIYNLASVKWLLNAVTSASMNVLSQSSVVDFSPVMTGIHDVTVLHLESNC